jgi:hypothetical protein
MDRTDTMARPRRHQSQREIVKNSQKLIAEVDVELALIRQQLTEPVIDEPLLSDPSLYERPSFDDFPY